MASVSLRWNGLDSILAISISAISISAISILAIGHIGNQYFGNCPFGNQYFGHWTFSNQYFGNWTFGNQYFGNQWISAMNCSYFRKIKILFIISKASLICFYWQTLVRVTLLFRPQIYSFDRNLPQTNNHSSNAFKLMINRWKKSICLYDFTTFLQL